MLFVSLKACYLCSILDPTVFAYTKVVSNGDKLSYIEVHWEFSKLYAAMSAQSYDENFNTLLDSQELFKVRRDFFRLLEDNDYNTIIKINKKQIKQISPLVFDKSVHLSYKKLESSFKIRLDANISDVKSLEIDYIDKNEILAFFVKDEFLSVGFKAKTNEKDQSLPLEIYPNQEPTTQNINISQTPYKQSFLVSMATLLQTVQHKIGSLLLNAKNNPTSLSVIVLLAFAFVYGLIHASGPGHGKSLVASYCLSKDKDIKKALFISVAIGFVHVFSAFFLTLIAYVVLNELLSQRMQEAQGIITKISALIILAIAVSMMIKKIKLSRANKRVKFTLHKPSCSCASCAVSNKTTDLGVILSAGIIPCPGTVTIFIFTLSLKTYFLGFLAAILMSFGMSLIIFLSASLSIMLKKSLLKTRLAAWLETFSIGFIFLLGVLLLIQPI